MPSTTQMSVMSMHKLRDDRSCVSVLFSLAFTVRTSAFAVSACLPSPAPPPSPTCALGWHQFPGRLRNLLRPQLAPFPKVTRAIL